MSNCTILLPILNEVSSIGSLIDEIRLICPQHRIVTVDGGSHDGSDTVVIERRVTLLRAGRGKGLAVRSAFEHISTECIIMMDSDGTYPPVHIPQILNLLDDRAEVVIGCRDIKLQGSMTFANKAGNTILSLLASILYGCRVKDLCSGMWGFRKQTLNKFRLTSDGFTLEADLFVNAVKNRCTIHQVPIQYRPRSGDPSKLRLWDGFKIAWFLIKERFT